MGIICQARINRYNDKEKKTAVYNGRYFILLVISYISISLYYNTHFYMNTTINGIETSNMTVEQAEEVIQRI